MRTNRKKFNSQKQSETMDDDYTLLSVDCIQHIFSFRPVQTIFHSVLVIEQLFGRKDGRVFLLQPNLCFAVFAKEYLFLCKYLSHISFYWNNDVTWNETSSGYAAVQALKPSCMQSIHVLTGNTTNISTIRTTNSYRFDALITACSRFSRIAKVIRYLDFTIDENYKLIATLCHLFPALKQLNISMENWQDIDSKFVAHDPTIHHHGLKKLMIQEMKPATLNCFLPRFNISELHLKYGTIAESDIESITRSSVHRLYLSHVALPSNILHNLARWSDSMRLRLSPSTSIEDELHCHSAKDSAVCCKGHKDNRMVYNRTARTILLDGHLRSRQRKTHESIMIDILLLQNYEKQLRHFLNEFKL